MFTGIVEAAGRVHSLEEGVLRLEARLAGEPVAIGESIAVNGCCLTVVPDPDGRLRFDLSPETLARTSLGGLATGARVNLERALAANGRFGGHVVQGHVDATARLVAKREEGNSTVLTFDVGAEHRDLLIDKGSVALDGVSLTVVRPDEGRFEVWVIPHTLQETNLGERQVGDPLNVEFDVLAKYVVQLARRTMADV